MQLIKILEILDQIAPFEFAEDWDNSGLMVGDASCEIERIVVALDPGYDTISYAIEHSADLILTHHPLIFRPLACLDMRDAVSRKVCMLAKNDIALVSMHTNLDHAEGGVADTLALRLGLEGVRSESALRMGTIDGPLSLSDWVSSLNVGHAKVVDSGRDVSCVGACPGSGMEYWKDALAAGCDTFVTGDVRYHQAFDALEAGMNVVDLGHYATEVLVVDPLSVTLSRELTGVKVLPYEGREIFKYTKR